MLDSPDPIRCLIIWDPPLSELLRYDDELGGFYRDRDEVEHLAQLGCSIQPNRISIEDNTERAHLLERRGNTYLLVEMTAKTGRWNTHFAHDPKGVLQAIIDKEWLKNWEMVFPLIRAAHAAAHPESGKEPDSKYLERLMAEALHYFDPKKFIADQNRGAGPGKSVLRRITGS